jgi:hypothetical protein
MPTSIKEHLYTMTLPNAQNEMLEIDEVIIMGELSEI